MGRWGQRLFEGDMDLDVASEISTEAGAELLYYQTVETDTNHSDHHGGNGLGVEATCALLNDGRLQRMFGKYRADEDLYPSNDYYLIILGALAMGVGAAITTRQMQLLRLAHKETPVVDGYALPLFDSGFRTQGAAQFEDAINGYQNGTPWDFSTPGPKESGLRLAKENVRDLKLCKKCEKLQADLSDNKKLRACGECKRVAYCTKECQKEDWKNHKKDCGPADAPNNTGNPNAPICLNQ